MNSTNPFTVEKDNKKFFLGVARNSVFEYDGRNSNADDGKSRIKRLNEEIQQLAREKEETLFKDAQVNYIFKKQKPVIKLEDYIDKERDSKRVRNPIKQKKQSVNEYINKKKEVFLSKMNINIKKEQTNKLEDYIRDEQETLRARQLYYKNDVEFMNNFIAQVKREAEAAQPKADELAFTENLTRVLTSLETQIQKKQNLISKAQDDFKNLSKYKQFLDKFLHMGNSSWKPYHRREEPQDMFFITEGDNKKPQTPIQSRTTIKFSPQNLLQIFNQILENNLSEIQNSHDTQSQLQKILKEERKVRELNQKTQLQYTKRLSLLQKSLQNQSKKNTFLKEMKRNNTTRIKITDSEDLDLEKIGNKIVEIYRDISVKAKMLEINNTDSKQLKKCMKEIEQEITRLHQQIEKERLIDPARNQEIHKKIKENNKKENLIRKQELSKDLQAKKMNEQSKKREQSELHLQKGRRAMAKVLVEKPSKVKRVQQTDSHDHDQKYFRNQNKDEEEG